MRRDPAGHPVAGAGRPARPGALDRAVRRLVRPVALAAAPRRTPTEFRGVEVPWSAQPLLWSLVDAVAADLGQPVPNRLRVCLGGGATACEDRHRVLLLPLSDLAALSEVELRAAVAHGLSHVPARPLELGAAFAAYWSEDVSPLLRAGLRPPIAAGFALYLAAPAVRGGLARPVAPADATPASALLLDLDGLELALLDRAAGPGRAALLRPVDWRDGPARALPQVWADRARWLPDPGLRAGQIAAALRARVERQPGDPIAAGDALMLFGAALSRALACDGWSVVKAPGAPCALARGGAVVVPTEELAAVASGAVAPDAWTERCRRLGIADLGIGDRP